MKEIKEHLLLLVYRKEVIMMLQSNNTPKEILILKSMLAYV
jgi:hypothetical protein